MLLTRNSGRKGTLFFLITKWFARYFRFYEYLRGYLTKMASTANKPMQNG